MRKSLLVILIIYLPWIVQSYALSEDKTDPAYFIVRLYETYQSIYDYRARFEYIENVNGKEKIKICEFSFMKPNYRKLKVLEGENKGASVAYNPSKNENRVAAKKGIFPMPGGLSLDDSRLGGFFSSGWGNEIEEVVNYADAGELEIVCEEDVDSARAVCISIVPSDTDSISKVLVWIDKKEFLLLRTEFYKENEFFSRKTWFDIGINIELGVDDFVP